MVLVILLSVLNIDGKAFLGFRYEMDGNVSEFYISRVYLNFRAVLSDSSGYGFAFRFTPDVYNDSGKYLLYVKYAYVEVRAAPFRFYLGQHSTPYLYFVEDKSWKFRFISKLPADRYGLMSSADRGVSVRYSGSILDLHTGIYSGEGYKMPEKSHGKDFMGRFSLKLPFSYVNAYVQVGDAVFGDSSFTRTLVGASVSLAWRGILLHGEYFSGKDAGIGKHYPEADIFSAFVAVPVGEYSLFVRYDIFGSGMLRRVWNRYILSGLVYRVEDGIRMGLSYGHSVESGSIERTLSVSMELKF